MPTWPAPSSSPSRASAPLSSPLAYAAKTIASDAVDVFRDSPRLLLRLLLLHSSFHVEPPTHHQAISHDSLFDRSKPSNREASGPLRRAHHRPRSLFVLAIVFLTTELPPLVILGRTFDRATLGTLILLTVLVSSIRSLLISGPFLDWFGTRLPPSLTILDRCSAVISGITPFFPLRRRCLIQLLPRHPQPHLTHLNLSRNALRRSEHHRPSLPRCYPPLLHTSDLSPVDHHCLDVIPRQPLASCCVAIVSHPGRATAKPPPPLPLSSRETKEGKLPWVDMGKMRKER